MFLCSFVRRLQTADLQGSDLAIAIIACSTLGQLDASQGAMAGFHE
jgi:hypothetical protein